MRNMSSKFCFDNKEEEEKEEKEEEELVKSALLLSKRLSDNEFEPLPYDLHDDTDYIHTQTSIPEELQQLASFFTQMMQMGPESESESHPKEEDLEKEDKEDDDDDDEVMTASREDGETENTTPPCLLPNALHHAVFCCEVQAIMALLDEENKTNPQDFNAPAGTPFRQHEHSLDTPDHCGNTPLLLAVKLGHIDLAKLLIAEGFQCDITSKIHLDRDSTSADHDTSSASSIMPLRTREGAEFHLMDECVLLRSVPLIKAVYKQMQINTYNLWLEKKKIVLQTLLAIPDFYVELGWEFTGSGLMGPVVKMFAPYDTYRIWKRGNWLRLDSTISEIHPQNLKVERAHTSLIFQGSSTEDCCATWGEGELYVLNRKEETYERILRKFSNPSDTELNHFAHHMIAVHSVRKGGFMKTKSGGKNSGSSSDSGDNHNNHMSVNSVDVDANNWTVKGLVDRRGVAKTVRLSGDQGKRDVYADLTESSSNSSNSSLITSGVETKATSTPAAAVKVNSPHQSVAGSRLCYKWEASGYVRASVASKTTQDAHIFQQLSEEAYFGAASATPPVSSVSSALDDGVSASSKSRWSRGKKKKEKKPSKAREIKKKVQAAMYMVKDYPISLSELLPVLDVFAMKNEYLKKLVDIFNGNVSIEENKKPSPTEKFDTEDGADGAEELVSRREKKSKDTGSEECEPEPLVSFLNIPAELFPYRIQVPIILGISAMATFENFQRNPVIDPALFSIDPALYTELN